MPNRPAAFKQTDLTRAIKAAVKAGWATPRVEIRPDGTIILSPIEGPDPNAGPNPCDELLK